MILITGASGNVGREVLKQIPQARQPVRAAYQSPQKAADAPDSVETVIVDFNQPETLRAASYRRRRARGGKTADHIPAVCARLCVEAPRNLRPLIRPRQAVLRSAALAGPAPDHNDRSHNICESALPSVIVHMFGYGRREALRANCVRGQARRVGGGTPGVWRWLHRRNSHRRAVARRL